MSIKRQRQASLVYLSSVDDKDTWVTLCMQIMLCAQIQHKNDIIKYCNYANKELLQYNTRIRTKPK